MSTKTTKTSRIEDRDGNRRGRRRLGGGRGRGLGRGVGWVKVRRNGEIGGLRDLVLGEPHERRHPLAAHLDGLEGPPRPPRHALEDAELARLLAADHDADNDVGGAERRRRAAEVVHPVEVGAGHGPREGNGLRPAPVGVVHVQLDPVLRLLVRAVLEVDVAQPRTAGASHVRVGVLDLVGPGPPVEDDAHLAPARLRRLEHAGEADGDELPVLAYLGRLARVGHVALEAVAHLVRPGRQRRRPAPVGARPARGERGPARHRRDADRDALQPPALDLCVVELEAHVDRARRRLGVGDGRRAGEREQDDPAARDGAILARHDGPPRR